MTKDQQKAAALKKHRANEVTHKVVVKVISWKAGLLAGASVQPTNKISAEEWNHYRQHVFKIYKSEGADTAKSKLTSTEQAIRAHQGFEQ